MQFHIVRHLNLIRFYHQLSSRYLLILTRVDAADNGVNTPYIGTVEITERLGKASRLGYGIPVYRSPSQITLPKLAMPDATLVILIGSR